MSRIRKITNFKSEHYYDRSVWLGEDWVSEMRFKKCVLDAMVKVERKYVKDVRSNIDYSSNVDDKCIEDAKAKVDDSALQESDRWLDYKSLISFKPLGGAPTD